VDQLPLERYGAYLHTAAFEGMPNLVLELGARGMPVVASDVGGLSELLNRENGWLVNTSTGDLGAQAGRLAGALEQLFGDPAQARQRGLALQEKLRQQHSPEVFGAGAPALSGFFRPIRGRAG
jgi:glycosyltransferase involved in cell wall biosynthesis